ncbi:predicted protein [Postia placenta Mad-698-R]|nr:predicted protein [Postia placenta Mad-698-R]
MPTISSGKVLVTGANGFVATWVVYSLLEHGYSVRASVRSEGKGAHLCKIFASYGDKFELAIVPDITSPGAFDEAVKGVDAIEHTASPVHLNADDPDEFIVPAVKGTIGVLESALAHGTSVKRVVYTSSCVSILRIPEQPTVFSEKDWNEQAVEDVKANGRNATGLSKYSASKVLAERAAWEFVEKNKARIAWDLVVVNPPYVFGPTLNEVDKPESLHSSMDEWFKAVCGGIYNTAPWGSDGGPDYIDVRDLALAHVLAIQKEGAGGERLIISSGPWKWQDFTIAGRKIGAVIPAGNTSYDPAKATHLIMYDASKAPKVLGIKYRSIDETTRDILEDYKARGWVKFD